MSLKASSRKNKQKTFGTNLNVDSVRPDKKKAPKPRPIRNPGGRSGLKKGAGG